MLRLHKIVAGTPVGRGPACMSIESHYYSRPRSPTPFTPPFDVKSNLPLSAKGFGVSKNLKHRRKGEILRSELVQ
jgi:hypothetical protein